MCECEREIVACRSQSLLINSISSTSLKILFMNHDHFKSYTHDIVVQLHMLHCYTHTYIGNSNLEYRLCSTTAKKRFYVSMAHSYSFWYISVIWDFFIPHYFNYDFHNPLIQDWVYDYINQPNLGAQLCTIHTENDWIEEKMGKSH